MCIIVTGGGSGIGQALAIELAKRDKQVVIAGRRQEALLETKSQNDTRIDMLVCDLSQPQGRATLVEYVSQYQRVDALVNNAATIAPIAPLKDVELEAWQQAQAINVEAPLFLTQALLTPLAGGRVLNISSGAAHQGFQSWASYCVSKSALFMLYQCFKLEESDIAFGSVMPGITDTSMQQALRESEVLPEGDRQFFASLFQSDKLISPKVVAQFLAWLLLDIDAQRFSEKEWDIYDSTSHGEWLKEGIVPKVFDNE